MRASARKFLKKIHNAKLSSLKLIYMNLQTTKKTDEDLSILQ